MFDLGFVWDLWWSIGEDLADVCGFALDEANRGPTSLDFMNR